MNISGPAKPGRKERILNLTLAVVAAQVGCLTLIIVLGAIFSGLWLDNRLQTRPVMTLVLVVVSVPISVFTMLGVVRATVKRMKTGSSGKEKTNIGTDPNS